jgi:hypothetical protein
MVGSKVGDPAWDIFGFDLYDRSSQGRYKRHWSPIKGGNQMGIDGYLDRLVSIVNTYPGSSFTHAKLHWGIGELATKYGGVEGRGTNADALQWWQEIVDGIKADSATCHALLYFQSDDGGSEAPHDMPASNDYRFCCFVSFD